MRIRPENGSSHPGYRHDSSDYGLPYQDAGVDAVNGARQQMSGFLADLSESAQDQRRYSAAVRLARQSGAAGAETHRTTLAQPPAERRRVSRSQPPHLHEIPYPNSSADALHGAQQQTSDFLNRLSGFAGDQRRMNHSPAWLQQPPPSTPRPSPASPEQPLPDSRPTGRVQSPNPYDIPYRNSGADAVNGAREQMSGFLRSLSGVVDNQRRMVNAPIQPQQPGPAQPPRRP